ncbi:MAG: thiamine phosphate synthase [Dehalococcoidia bacterium]|nr:thiamine phosphate synthase [Dehalococcoidia bacterium]MDW8119997.1 thiamine phosphate synthase [Chloroflexota bacterium]
MTERVSPQPVVPAYREALAAALRTVEAAVTQPIGLAYDVRTLRQALRTTGADEEEADPLRGWRVPPAQGLEAAVLARRALGLLQEWGALDGGLAERVRKVLDRAEARLGADLRRPLAQRVRGLYVIIDPAQCRGRNPLDIAESALRGGAHVLQWRDKQTEKGTQLQTLAQVRTLCTRYNALLIVNDHADLAVAAEADGLHIGQLDLPLPHARQVLRPGHLIGRSHALLEEALASQAQGADYIAVGTIFGTTSKAPERTRYAGLETLRKVKQAVQAPVVAIGGITASHVAQVIEAGADAVAVLSAVCGADDPEKATRDLVEAIRRAQASP